MATIVDVPLGHIKPNPYRNLATYPWIEAKVEQLMRSIEDVGLWEGIIARPVHKNFEAAFGHHRLEAARRLNLETAPLILRALSDRDMIRFMGRENGEDYNSDFLVLLNTWEGAVRFCEPMGSQSQQPIEIAKILGWFHPHGSGRGSQMSHAAAACAAAHDLVRQGHMSRDDLRGLSARDARELVIVAHKDIADLDRAAKDNPVFTPRKLIQAKNIIARGAKITATDVRAGRVLKKDIRTEVRLNVLRDTRRRKPKMLPLFSRFGRAVIGKIDRMLEKDRAALHITQIEEALSQITQEDDRATIRDLHHSLDQLGKRVDLAIRRTTAGKVVNLKSIKGDV